MEGVRRRLSAILCTDVAGYSRLVGENEADTLARLKALRDEVIDPRIAECRGRIVKTTGDGLLVEFPSVVDAVRCAIDIQRQMPARDAGLADERRMQLRMGIHMGDIVVDGDDILGDGVNVAARLEALAEPGGLCVSGRVREDLEGKLTVGFQDMGEQALKNIARPVRVWHWKAQLLPDAPPPVRLPEMPDKPSIAVMPFANLSGDPEQDYFADGIVEDILTALSLFKQLFVIARNSSFTYKGRDVDVRQVGRELGVRYVLEGSIRKASNRVRISAQLIDAASGQHIWAERYDRVMDDIFALQEELTQSIVGTIAPHIQAAEGARAARRRPESLGAYEIAVRAWSKACEANIRADRTLLDAAVADARAALALDAASALALNALAHSQYQRLFYGLATDPQAIWEDGMAAATRAIEADRLDCMGYSTRSRLLAHAPDRDRTDDALTNARRGYELNPNSVYSLYTLGGVENMAGDPENAIEPLRKALRLSPRDPLRYLIHVQLARANVFLGDYAAGVQNALMGLAEAPEFPSLLCMLAVGYVGLGDMAKGRIALDEARRCGPGYVERGLAGKFVYRNPEHLRRVTTFLRVAAGLEPPAMAAALR